MDTRIREFKEEQEALAKQRGPINPYAALAELYAEQEQEEKQKAVMAEFHKPLP